jgi:hypothetical protein
VFGWKFKLKNFVSTFQPVRIVHKGYACMMTIFPITQDTGGIMRGGGGMALDPCQQNLVAHGSGLCCLDGSQQATCIYICTAQKITHHKIMRGGKKPVLHIYISIFCPYSKSPDLKARYY